MINLMCVMRYVCVKSLHALKAIKSIPLVSGSVSHEPTWNTPAAANQDKLNTYLKRFYTVNSMAFVVFFFVSKKLCLFSAVIIINS